MRVAFFRRCRESSFSTEHGRKCRFTLLYSRARSTRTSKTRTHTRVSHALYIYRHETAHPHVRRRDRATHRPPPLRGPRERRARAKLQASRNAQRASGRAREPQPAARPACRERPRPSPQLSASAARPQARRSGATAGLRPGSRVSHRVREPEGKAFSPLVRRTGPGKRKSTHTHMQVHAACVRLCCAPRPASDDRSVRPPSRDERRLSISSVLRAPGERTHTDHSSLFLLCFCLGLTQLLSLV